MIISATQRWSYIRAVVNTDPELPVGDESKRNPRHSSQLAEQALQAADITTSKTLTVEEMQAERAYHFKRLGITDLKL